MRKKVSILVKNIKNLINIINPSILSASMAFILLIIIIPFSVLVHELLVFLNLDTNILENELNQNTKYLIINNIFMLLSVIFVSSKLIYSINLYSVNLLSNNNESYIKFRFKSFLKMIILILIILIIITINIVINRMLEMVTLYYLRIFINFILNLISFIIIIYFYYLFVFPIKLKFKLTIFTSFCVIVIQKILTNLFKLIIVNILKSKYFDYYGTFTNLFLFIIWLYYISYIIVIGLMFLYYNFKNNE
jgi:uncharacterized BrkB/YihY/UPF0761 family membrane protein